MHRDIFRSQLHHLPKRGGESGGGIPRQPGDQIHVDGKFPGIADLFIGPPDVPGGVRPAHLFQYGVIHGLRIHRHPVHPVTGQNRHFLRVDGIGPAGLHGELTAPGQGQMLLHGGKHPVQLGGRQGSGGAAPHIQAAHRPPRLL